LIIAGNITLDDIVTKYGTYENMLGGPPTYSVKPLHSVFGIRPSIYSCVGYDFPKEFENEIASLSKLYITKSSKQTTKFRLVEENGRHLFLLSFSGEINYIDFSSESVYMFSPVYREIKVNFLSDACKVGLVSLDPQGYLRVVDENLRVHIKPNEIVWKALKFVNIFRTSIDEYLALAEGLSIRRFLEKTYGLGVEVAIVTSSKKVYVVSNGKYLEFPTYPHVSVKSTTGAGDVFTSFFTYVYSRSYDLEKAITYAIVASSFAVENIGPSSISRDHFFRRLREYMGFMY